MGQWNSEPFPWSALPSDNTLASNCLSVMIREKFPPTPAQSPTSYVMLGVNDLQLQIAMENRCKHKILLFQERNLQTKEPEIMNPLQRRGFMNPLILTAGCPIFETRLFFVYDEMERNNLIDRWQPYCIPEEQLFAILLKILANPRILKTAARHFPK